MSTGRINRICLTQRSDIEFVVQSHHYGEDSSIKDADEHLLQIPEVRVLHGTLPPIEYALETSRVDIILLPYDPEVFGSRGSGLFAESVSAGRLIVAARGTWAAQNVDNGEAIGEVFDSYDSTGLAKAILRVCEKAPVLLPQALRKASGFAKAHSIDTYVDRILALAAQVCLSMHPAKSGGLIEGR